MESVCDKTSSKLLNVGCGTHYAQGWLNTDYVSDETVHPDLIITAENPYPFDDNTFDAVYMGHVLEHVPWNDVPLTLTAVNRILKPGCPVMIVGPDVLKSLNEWKNSSMHLELLKITMEHTTPSFNPVRSSFEHHWNCHEARLMQAMCTVFEKCEIVSNRIPLDDSTHFFDEGTGINWPINLWTAWQTAIIGHATI